MVLVLFFDDLFQGMLVGTVLMYGGLILFSGWVIGRGKLAPERLVGTIPSHYSWWPAIFLVIAMITYSLSAEWITHYPIAINWPELYQEFLDQPLFLTEQDVTDPVPYNILTLITAVIIAPVVEEVFFRILLFPRLSVKWGTATGIIVSSLLFALLHPMAWVGAFVIAIHSLNNAIAVLVAWWAISHGWDTTFDLSELRTELYMAIVLLVLSSPVVFGLIGRWWPARGDQLPYFAKGIIYFMRAHLPVGLIA
jgi:membrane protease YdiL (CAAX protease family)